MTFPPAPRKIISSSWMIWPLPRDRPAARCNLPKIALKLLFAEPALEEGAGVNTRCRVRLEKYEVAVLCFICRAEEMIEADLKDFGGGSVARDVPAKFAISPVGAHDHCQGVPADDRGNPSLHFDIAR